MKKRYLLFREIKAARDRVY